MTPALLATALIAMAGCGQSQKESYFEDYRPLNDRLLGIGVSIGAAPSQAGRRSDARLATRFAKYASDLDDVSREIAALDTPDDFREDSETLTDTIGVVVKDLEKMSRAARQGDGKTAAAAARALADDSDEVNRAQNRLAAATGADRGPR